MQKKLSHLVLVLELAAISLIHAAKLHRNTTKEVAKAPLQLKQQAMTARLLMSQHQP